MNKEHFPQRTQRYIGFATDSLRWDHFSARDDDIFICTPYKCGTTWTQALCALLIFKDPDHQKKPAMISPWIDSHLMPVEAMNAMLAAQNHRRFIKTHTPIDGINYSPDSTYILVYRDPRDVYFSLRNHIENMNMEVQSEWLTDDLSESFRNWSLAPNVVGASELFTLSEMVHHYNSFQRFKHLPNIHFFHFSDFKQDLLGQMQRLAGIFDIEIEMDLMARLSISAHFSSMRENASQFVPASGMQVWKSEKRFFNRGDKYQLTDLSPADLEIYNNSISQSLEQEQIEWLETGYGI
ncbi:MAG: hypothetical protein CMQ39_08330 [Gammaproteobacteria bacterium]|nr:hypothetical protein [Gammaproteobacteria bacterium]